MGDEYEYLRLVKQVLEDGAHQKDRTGTGTISCFGTQSRYSLQNGVVPVLTTKRVYWKGVVEELLWFIRGCTDAKELSARGVKIWDANGSRAFLDNLGFHDRREGDLGPVYGFQWRHWGAKYEGPDKDYSGQGVDQLADVIRLIREEPHSRRIILSAWNVADLPLMALPPCHSFVQFYVHNDRLSCQLYQRSADLGLGVPFNIASYGLLTHMIAHVTGTVAHELIHTIGDAHVYSNHCDALRTQLTRTPGEFPQVRFSDGITSIDDFKSESIQLVNYSPQDAIHMHMAV